MATLNYVQNNTAPGITFTVSRAGSGIVNLTGATVKFIIQDTTSLTETNAGHNTCIVSAPTTGVATYAFQTGDLPNAVLYQGDLQITWGDGSIETGYTPTYLNVRAAA